MESSTLVNREKHLGMHENRKLFLPVGHPPKGAYNLLLDHQASLPISVYPFYKIIDPISAIGQEIIVVLHCIVWLI